MGRSFMGKPGDWEIYWFLGEVRIMVEHPSLDYAEPVWVDIQIEDALCLARALLKSKEKIEEYLKEGLSFDEAVDKLEEEHPELVQGEGHGDTYWNDGRWDFYGFVRRIFGKEIEENL